MWSSKTRFEKIVKSSEPRCDSISAKTERSWTALGKKLWGGSGTVQDTNERKCHTFVRKLVFHEGKCHILRVQMVFLWSNAKSLGVSVMMRSVMQSVWEEMGGISKSTLFFWERMSYSGQKSGISYQKRHPVGRQSPICGRRVVFLWENVLFLVASAKCGLVLWYFGEKTCGSCKKMGEYFLGENILFLEEKVSFATEMWYFCEKMTYLLEQRGKFWEGMSSIWEQLSSFWSANRSFGEKIGSIWEKMSSSGV